MIDGEKLIDDAGNFMGVPGAEYYSINDFIVWDDYKFRFADFEDEMYRDFLDDASLDDEEKTDDAFDEWLAERTPEGGFVRQQLAADTLGFINGEYCGIDESTTRKNKMKKLNLTKEQYNRSRYFKTKYGKLKYVSESGKFFKTSKGKVLMFKEGIDYDDAKEADAKNRANEIRSKLAPLIGEDWVDKSRAWLLNYLSKDKVLEVEYNGMSNKFTISVYTGAWRRMTAIHFSYECDSFEEFKTEFGKCQSVAKEVIEIKNTKTPLEQEIKSLQDKINQLSKQISDMDKDVESLCPDGWEVVEVNYHDY